MHIYCIYSQYCDGWDDVQAIRQAVADLQQASIAMAHHLQGRQTVGAGAALRSAGRAGQGQEGVIDADFEVKK
jgi:hypothetical protein